MEKRELPYTVGRNANWCSHYGEQYGGSLKKLGLKPPYDPAIPLLGIYPEETIIEKDASTPVFFLFFLNFILFYNIVLVLPYINMHLPQVYTCSPSWTLLPPPSPYHPSGSSQCTSPKLPVSCIEPGLATRFIYDSIHVSMPFSQIIPNSYTFVSKTLLNSHGSEFKFIFISSIIRLKQCIWDSCSSFFRYWIPTT